MDHKTAAVGKMNSTGVLLRTATGTKLAILWPVASFRQRLRNPAKGGSGMLKHYRVAPIAGCLLFLPVQGAAAPMESQPAIASAIKAEVAEIIAGINTKDIGKATRFDAPD